MKKTVFTVIIMFILAMFFVSCGWKVEIVDPTKPAEGESELVISEEEESKPEESEQIQEEAKDGEPLTEEFFIMKICEGEERSASDFVSLSDEEKTKIHSALASESWMEVPEDWNGRGSFSSPVNILHNAPRDCMYISTDGENTLITLKWGTEQENVKYYHAPANVAVEIEELRAEFAKKVASERIEPEIKDFTIISLYENDDIHIRHEFSEEEFSEWISVVKPEEWKDYNSESEGGSISTKVMLFTPSRMIMFMGYDVSGNEIALIKYGRNRNLGKKYILPKGILSAAEEFEKKMLKENPSVYNYPECNYDMSAKAFLNRENDDYILYLDQMLLCCNWNAAKDDPSIPYEGFSSASELNSKIMFNLYLFSFEYCGAAAEENMTKAIWFRESDEKYHIPMTDIYTVLGKYFCDFNLKMEETTVNYELDESTNEIAIFGGYGVNSFMGETRNVVSVTDNGDGTLTAVVESHVYHMDDNDNMILSEKPEKRNTMILRPWENGCWILSHKIESIGD